MNAKRNIWQPLRLLMATALSLSLLSVAVYTVAASYFAQYKDGEMVRISFEAEDNAGYSSLSLLAHLHDYALQICCSHSFTTVVAPGDRDGNAGRFSLQPSDNIVKGNYRSELRLLSNPLKHETWYQISVFVPPEWHDSTVKVVAMQWHGTRDFLLGEPGRMPPLEITIVDDQWLIQKAFDDKVVSTTDRLGNVEAIVPLAKVQLEKGRWLDWIIQTRWSSSDDGRLAIWLNGEQIVDDQGPNAHKDLTGPYLKAGVYVPSWGYEGTEPQIAERTLYFDNIQMIQATNALDLSNDRSGLATR